jgi:hypothetical protein
MNAMSYANEPAMLLVREGAELPPDVAMESETFLSGWRVVKNFDNYVLRRKMRGTNWSFLRLHGSKETRLVGRRRQDILRRGVEQILAELKGRKFNALEVTVHVTRRILGVTFLSISVNRRHFQCNVPAKA